jgi:hypothetical protein
MSLETTIPTLVDAMSAIWIRTRSIGFSREDPDIMPGQCVYLKMETDRSIDDANRLEISHIHVFRRLLRTLILELNFPDVVPTRELTDAVKPILFILDGLVEVGAPRISHERAEYELPIANTPWHKYRGDWIDGRKFLREFIEKRK